METTAAFVYRNGLHTDSLAAGRQRLFTLLQERDVRPVVTIGTSDREAPDRRGAEAPFRGDRVLAHQLEGAREVPRSVGELALGSQIGVLINRAHRSLRLEGALPPVINENETRSLSHRKHLVQTNVLGPIGTGLSTHLITSGEDIDMFLSNQTESHRFVAKPDGGSGGKNVVRELDAAGLRQLFIDNPERIGSHIVQPQADFSGRLPRGIQPYDESARESFEGWNQPNIVKEVGMYAFYANGSTEVWPVGRAVSESYDEWFYVDPESVEMNTRLPDITRRAFAVAAEQTQAVAIYGRLDFGHDPSNGANDGWTAVEMNMKAPTMVSYDDNPEIADNLRTLYADQIATASRPA